jgi:hypothetical protein
MPHPCAYNSTAYLDNQSDSEKKQNAMHSKALGKKRPNPGSVWFTAVTQAGVFSATQEPALLHRPSSGLSPEPKPFGRKCVALCGQQQL